MRNVPCSLWAAATPIGQAAGVEQRLAGGNTGGAVRVGDTVRRTPGPWTPAVHALLMHLHDVGFDRCPRPLGFDAQGREVLGYLAGATCGDSKPWPSWVHSEDALSQAAEWLRDYHQAVVSFRPPEAAVWRTAAAGVAPDLICHNDAAPYNAAWDGARLSGFFDWDFAAPATREWDLAFTAFAWVPLHARHVVREEGFTAFADRRRRLEVFLDAYGFTGDVDELTQLVRHRLTEHIHDLQRLAAAGDPLFQKLIDQGSVDNLNVALQELSGALDPSGEEGRAVGQGAPSGVSPSSTSRPFAVRSPPSGSRTRWRAER